MVQITPSPAAKLYLRDIMNTQPLSKEKEQELFKLYHCGSASARQTLLMANMRFVLKVARQYRNANVSLTDLVSEGALGLIRALESYESSRGWKFISYAVWWIKVYITRYINDRATMIRLPANKKIKIQKALKSAKKGERLDSEIQQLILLSERGLSLDSPIASDSGISFSDVIADERQVSPDTSIDIERDKCLTHLLLKGLPTREADVLKRFYGIDSNNSETLKEISETMGISKERIRQIRDKALFKLRKSPYQSVIKEHVAQA